MGIGFQFNTNQRLAVLELLFFGGQSEEIGLVSNVRVGSYKEASRSGRRILNGLANNWLNTIHNAFDQRARGEVLPRT